MGGGSQGSSPHKERMCRSSLEQVPPKNGLVQQLAIAIDDVLPVELLQRIQLELPSQDAARTSILSKSWLHAWSTTPSLRLHCPATPSCLKNKENQKKYMRGIHLTLLRYQRHKLPIASFDIQLGLHTTNYPAARKLIKQAAITPSLKELRVAILAVSFELPDEIFSNQNLNMLTLELITPFENLLNYSLSLRSRYPVVRCTNLRVLVLAYVYITPYLLNELLSMNKLLETVFLGVTTGLDEIKVNNLRYLREFEVRFGPYCWIDILEIHDTPSLCSLVFNTPISTPDETASLFDIRTIGGSLKILELDNVAMDDAFSNMIKSDFPVLEELILKIRSFYGNILDITSLTLRRLMLFFSPEVEEIKVQVYAPNLLAYTHSSSTVPIPLFTSTLPEQIELHFSLHLCIDESFYLKLREALQLSTKFKIEMTNFSSGVSDIFIERISNNKDMKTMFPHPATNVEELVLIERISNNKASDLCTHKFDWDTHCTSGSTLYKLVMHMQECPNKNKECANQFPSNNDSWETLLDAFFSICHPMYVKTNEYDEVQLKVAKYLSKLILQGVMESCEIRNPLDGRWVALTSSSLSLLHTTTPDDFYEFKLSWCSP